MELTMSTTARLDSQINKATYLSAIVLFVFTAVSMFGVYDAPAGSTAAEKVAWLNENNGAFVQPARSPGTPCSPLIASLTLTA